MFMDICNPSENSCFSKIFPVLVEMWFLLISTYHRTFHKMYFANLMIYNLFKSFLLTRCYRFLTRCEYYLWLDSKYNVRRCDVLVQNKTIHSLNLFALDRIFLKIQPESLVKPSMWYARRVNICIIVFIVSIWPDLLVFCWWFMSNIRNVFT